MKRFVTFFLICILTVYSTTICYAWNSALTGEQSQTDFGIYAIYIAGETEYLTSPVKKGKAEIQLPDGRRIVVWKERGKTFHHLKSILQIKRETE